MIFELNDIVRKKGGYYMGSNAKIVGREKPCTEESETYLVEILPTRGIYYVTYGIWVDVRKKYLESLHMKKEVFNEQKSEI
jgi:hypothetical protein